MYVLSKRSKKRAESRTTISVTKCAEVMSDEKEDSSTVLEMLFYCITRTREYVKYCTYSRNRCMDVLYCTSGCGDKVRAIADFATRLATGDKADSIVTVNPVV